MQAVLNRLEQLEKELKNERNVNRILQYQIADMNEKFSNKISLNDETINDLKKENSLLKEEINNKINNIKIDNDEIILNNEIDNKLKKIKCIIDLLNYKYPLTEVPHSFAGTKANYYSPNPHPDYASNLAITEREIKNIGWIIYPYVKYNQWLSPRNRHMFLNNIECYSYSYSYHLFPENVVKHFNNIFSIDIENTVLGNIKNIDNLNNEHKKLYNYCWIYPNDYLYTKNIFIDDSCNIYTNHFKIKCLTYVNLKCDNILNLYLDCIKTFEPDFKI